MRITLGTRSLILGMLLCAFLVLSSPVSVHAATIGPLAQAQAAKDGKTVNSETCQIADPRTEAGYTDVEESAAEKGGGTCDITYVGGGATVLSWKLGEQTNTPQTSAVLGSAVTSAVTSAPDAKAGDNAAMTGSGSAACDPLNPLKWGSCILDAMGYFILTLTSYILGIAGVLLNWVIVKTVFQFSTLVGNSPGLILAWGILRDLGNLLLLFGFVLMGIGTILDTSKLPDKRAIPKLILFAILLNFSIFAAEAVIDTSNVLTTVLYAQANTNPCVDDACNINNGIAGHIMEATGLSGIYKKEGAAAIDQSPNKLVILIGLALFATVGIVVLFATAIMLAFRAIVLTGLIIVSPIGFAGMALPKPFSSMASKWWNMLIHQSFFAPILFLLIFVDLKVTEGFSNGTNNNGLAQALTAGNGTSNMEILLIFALITGGLLAALMAAKSFGAMGASFAIDAATKVGFGSMNLSTSGTSRLARIAVQRSPIGDTKLGRSITNNVLSPIERGALDTRRLPGVTKALQMAGAKEGAKAHDSLAGIDKVAKKVFIDNPKEANKRYADQRAEQKAKDSRAELNRDIKNGTFSPSSERFLAGLSGKELETIPAVLQGDPAVIRALSPDQFESLMKSDNVSSSAKALISTARFADLQAQISAGDRAAVRQWTNKDLQQLAKSNATMFQQIISATDASGSSYLSDDQQENLGKSDSLTRTQRQNVRSYSVIGRIESNAAIPGPTAMATAAQLARTLNPKQKVKLGASALTNGNATEGVISTFTASDLAKIMEDGKLTDPQKHAIAVAIADPAHPNHASITTYLGSNPMAAGYWI